MNAIHHSRRRVGAALLSLALAGVALAQPDPGPSRGFSLISPDQIDLMSAADLKKAYMACDRAASKKMLDFSEAATCSQISEAVLQGVFEGDFDRLLAWWQQEKSAFQAAQAGAR